MAIDTVLPVATSLIEHGDSISFVVDDTYTSMVIQVVTESSTESCYDSASGGAQSGYTVSVASSGGRDTFTLARDAGFDVSPQLIHITENEDGTSTLTSLSYTLVSEHNYPQGDFPYNPIRVGDLTVTEEDAVVRTDVGWIDFNGTHFNVTDMGNGKVDVDTDITVYPLTVLQDTVSLSTEAASFDFTSPLTATEGADDVFTLSTGPLLHDASAANVVFCVQGDGDHVDTGPNTLGMSIIGSERYGPGHIMGTSAHQCSWGGTHGGVQTTAAETAVQLTGAMSAFAVWLIHDLYASSQPLFFHCAASAAAPGVAADNLLYGLTTFNSNADIGYFDNAVGVGIQTVISTYDFPIADGTTFHMGFTRSAAGLVTLYVNGKSVGSGSITLPTSGTNGILRIGTDGTNAASYCDAAFSSFVLYDTDLSAAQVLAIARRTMGR